MALYTLGLFQTHLHHVLMKTQTHQSLSAPALSQDFRVCYVDSLYGFCLTVTHDPITL